jgi:hypothetical protein
MSGPITRQYGVPNWDEIFGKNDEPETNPERQTEPKADERSDGSAPPEPLKSADQ